MKHFFALCAAVLMTAVLASPITADQSAGALPLYAAINPAVIA